MKKYKFSNKELDSLRMPEKLNPIEVAKKIKFDPSSNVLSKIDLDLTPYLVFPIELIGHYKVEWVFIVAPTQSGKTVYLQVVVAYTIDQNPRTLIYGIPDEKKGKKTFDEKVIKMIRKTPWLAKHVKRKIDLNTNQVRLDNMIIDIAWSNSPSSVSSTSAGVIVADEIRTWRKEISGESNALKQLNDRMTTYQALGKGQGFGVSSPSEEEDLLHQQTRVAGTINVWWHLRCKNSGCNKYFLPDFFRDLLPFFDKETGKAHVHCPFCLYQFTDTDGKKEMNRDGCYGPRGFEGSKQRLDNEDIIKYRVVCYWCSLSSPFRSFNTVVREYFATCKKISDYKNFIMCWLARFWYNDKSKTSQKVLNQRKSKKHRKGRVPTNCRFLTAGVDSQGYGFNVVVRAFCSKGKTYLVDEFVIHSPASNSSWEQVEQFFLDKIVNRIYLDDNKVEWKVALWAIDTQGNRTRQIKDATSNIDNCIRVNGATDASKMDIVHSKVGDWYNVKTKVYAEETDYLCLTEDWILPIDVSDEYCEQFLNMRKTEEINPKTGEIKVIWKKINNNNDYRMADIHSFIAIDIETDDGYTLRDKWNSEGFKQVNPAHLQTLEYDEPDDPEVTDEFSNDFYEAKEDSYEIDEIGRGGF